ncbi:cupin domain-containing protein [Raineyella fluvialis]|uniref:cupin domain-containing protein n=1 Tax=Raineyella fluvialis TaxID=2662261 RepID=UPI001EF14977
MEERSGDTFADLFDVAAADELLTHRGLRTPFLRMAKQGTTVPESAFTARGGVGAGIADQVDPDKVRRLFADGTSIVLQALHRTWEPVARFAQDLAAELGHPTQVNSYITPADNRGFEAHYDVHDVFVLQIHGTKHWVIHPPVLDRPQRDEPWNDRAGRVREASSAAPLLDTVLRPGDVLYLPRGFIHSARACGGTSVHLTIGIHPWTGQHVTSALLTATGRRLHDDPRVRTSLPVGIDPGEGEALRPEVERLREVLLDAVRTLDADAVLDTLAEQARDAQRADALPPLAQLDAADTLAPTSRVRLRRHLLVRLEDTDDGTLVTSRIGVVRLEADAAAVLQRLLEGRELTAREAGHGGGISAVADLVRQGLLEVLP